MDKLSEFEIARYKKVALQFLYLYETEGDIIAGLYAADQWRIQDLPIAHKFVVAVFIDAGYEFSEEFEDAITD
jgi:hypothetical protein